RLARQFVLEAFLLGVAGAVGGAVFSWVAIPALLSTVKDKLPAWSEFTPDLRILGFVTAVTIATSTIIGVIPALSASRFDLVEALKESGRSVSSGAGRGRMRRALVVCEIGFSTLLLVGAALMIQTFRNLNGLNAG